VNLWSFLWAYARRYRGWVGLALIASPLGSALTVMLLWLTLPLFRDVLRNTELAAKFAGPDELPKVGGLDLAGQFERAYQTLIAHFGITEATILVALPVGFFLVFFARSTTLFLNELAFQKIGLGATTDMRNDLYARILEHSSRFFARHPSGEIVSRIVNDIAVMQGAVANRLVDLLTMSLQLVWTMWLLLSLNFQLAMVLFIGVPVVGVVVGKFGRGVRRTSRHSQERMAELASLVAEVIRGFRVVKAFGMEEFEGRRFRDASGRHLAMSFRTQLLSAGSSPVVESIAALGAAALFWWIGSAIRKGGVDPAEFTTFLIGMISLYDPIRRLNKVNLVIQQAAAAATRVRDLLEVPVDIAERPGARELRTVDEAIRWEGVEFGYGDAPVLRGIDLEVRRGEVVALVGSSGAGKSTLVNLLLRFFDPDRGSVTIDGVDVRDVTLSSLRGAIGLVTQETVLFNDTVRANLAYGRADIPLERIEAAARAARAHDFIAALPQGYDTVIGEGGGRLSGGQRQRLAIARALLKDAPILVLDEATSQLDSESESLVQEALEALMRGRTTLVIAHRLATVVGADRIVAMEDGRIAEQGTHAELLAVGGVYRRFHDLQLLTSGETGGEAGS
jgi:subfamily B ATP-binding cassette protein MsbA